MASAPDNKPSAHPEITVYKGNSYKQYQDRFWGDVKLDHRMHPANDNRPTLPKFLSNATGLGFVGHVPMVHYTWDNGTSAQSKYLVVDCIVGNDSSLPLQINGSRIRFKFAKGLNSLNKGSGDPSTEWRGSDGAKYRMHLSQTPEAAANGEQPVVMIHRNGKICKGSSWGDIRLTHLMQAIFNKAPIMQGLWQTAEAAQPVRGIVLRNRFREIMWEHVHDLTHQRMIAGGTSWAPGGLDFATMLESDTAAAMPVAYKAPPPSPGEKREREEEEIDPECEELQANAQWIEEVQEDLERRWAKKAKTPSPSPFINVIVDGHAARAEVLD